MNSSGARNPTYPMHLVAVGIQHDDGGGPIHLELVHQGGVRSLDLNRDKVIIHELDDLVVGVRNRTHLLATDSLGIEKVQENGLFRLSGVVLGLGQIIQPADIQGHGDFLLFRDWGQVWPTGWTKHKHSWPKGKSGAGRLAGSAMAAKNKAGRILREYVSLLRITVVKPWQSGAHALHRRLPMIIL